MAILRHPERLERVHPRLVALANLLAASSPLDVCVVTGARTQADCERLYEEGRTTPGPHAGEPGYPALGLKVSRAKTCAQTAHTIRTTPEGDYACAVDLMFVSMGKLVDADTPAHRDMYESAGEVGEGEGFGWGGRFPDRDLAHFELKNFRDYPVAPEPVS